MRAAAAWTTAGLLLLAACTTPAGPGASGSPGPTASPPATPPTAAPTAVEEPTPAEVLAGDRVRLAHLRVTRAGRRLEVRALWAAERGPYRWVLASSQDGFRTVDYATGGQRRLLRTMAVPDPVPPRIEKAGAARLGRLVPWPATSLQAGTFAIAGGGDGATLFPFQRVVRSTDAGATWRRFDVSLFGGERGYSSGHVVAPGGRLLVLLDHFSGDRPHRPSARHHGLWSSRGDDWSSYRPVRVRLGPDQDPGPDGWPVIVTLGASADPDPVLWVTTWDHRAYVSLDRARTFREVRVR